MKGKSKVIAISTTVLLALCSLAACSDSQEQILASIQQITTTLNTAPPIEQETIETEETEITSGDEIQISVVTTESSNTESLSYSEYIDEEYDNRINTLMQAFIDRNKEDLCFLSSAQSEAAFDFIDNIVISDYTIISSEIIEGSNPSDFEKKYLISVNVGESSDERFPAGENTWEITALNAMSDYSFFGPLYFNSVHDKVNVRELQSENNISDEAYFCCRLMVELEPYIRYSDSNNLQIPDENTEEFYSSLSRFISSFVSEKSIDTYNMTAYKMFGIESDFNDENIEPLWLGAYEKDAVIVSENDNEIVIDFYADSLLLTKAYTIRFYLDTTDGIRLLSFEKIYESGLDVSFYTT